jgi:hypothetical protein
MVFEVELYTIHKSFAPKWFPTFPSPLDAQFI